MPPLTEDEFEKLRRTFNQQFKGPGPGYSFNWSSVYNRSPYEYNWKPPETEFVHEKAWLEIVVFVSPWNTKVEGSRSDGKMISKEVQRGNLQALFSGLNSRGMKLVTSEPLNSSTTVYRFRKET